jgi:hypothetical protein
MRVKPALIAPRVLVAALTAVGGLILMAGEAKAPKPKRPRIPTMQAREVTSPERRSSEGQLLTGCPGGNRTASLRPCGETRS